jgi:uridine kinase
MQKNYSSLSAFIIGLSLSTKFHVAAALPIVAIYLYKNSSLSKVISFISIALGTYIFFIAPYLLSNGFYHMVLTHPKQMMFFDVFADFGQYKIYLPLFALGLLYGRFITYQKINSDLLDAFLGIIFAMFILLILPAPGWYIWMIPFLSIFFITTFKKKKSVLWSFLALNCSYLIFFIFFYRSGRHDLIFINTPLDINIPHEKLSNIVFTLLEASLFLTTYMLYKFGVRSNTIYKRSNSLVIGISGDSGAGKSTFMQDIQNFLGSKSTLLEGDGDHRWERGDKNWQEYTHLNPKANHLHRQANNILHLKMGNPIYRQHYNHQTGKFDPAQPVYPNDFIIINGLHPFYLPKMRKLIDLKIFIDPSPKIRQHWKTIRDILHRGYTKEKIINQLKQREPDTKKYINPQKDFSDLTINYFSDTNFEIGNPDIQPKIKLKVILDSSVSIESLVQELDKANILPEWDYASDLKTQFIILSSPPTKEDITRISKKIIPNIEEFTMHQHVWVDGYRGFVQLITLLLLSEKLKESGSYEKI